MSLGIVTRLVGVLCLGTALSALGQNQLDISRQTKGNLPASRVSSWSNADWSLSSGNGQVLNKPIPISRVWAQAAECSNATAAAAWDLPTSSAPAPACKTGTNSQQGVLGFADGNSAQFEFFLPSDYNATPGFTSHIVFTSSATSGTVIFNVAVSCVAAAATDDPAFNTATAYTTVTQTTANVVQMPTATAITATGCAANNYVHVKIARATDTAADTAVAVRGVEFTFGRTL